MTQAQAKAQAMEQCAKDCQPKFNPERDPEKCTGKNIHEKGTCDHCMKECAYIGADPFKRCAIDCMIKFNPEMKGQDQVKDKCLKDKSGPCYKCLLGCKVAHGGASASRSFSVTVVVISFFVALMW